LFDTKANGIIGKKDGETKFAVNSATGDAIFKGNITGAEGVFSGSLSAGTVDFSSSVGYTNTYNTAGTYTLTVPANMTKMRLALTGGGGGGRAGSNRSYVDIESGGVIYGGGKGGDAGAKASAEFTVTPGQTFTLVVGQGGAAGTMTSDGPYYTAPDAPSGSETSVSGLLIAAGGAGGSGYAGIGSLPYSWLFPGGAGGGGAYGGSGSTGGTGGAGSNGYGGGGGGGHGSTAIYSNQPLAGFGGPGGCGGAVVEYYDPAGVVLKEAFNLLKSELTAQGHTLS